MRIYELCKSKTRYSAQKNCRAGNIYITFKFSYLADTFIWQLANEDNESNHNQQKSNDMQVL